MKQHQVTHIEGVEDRFQYEITHDPRDPLEPARICLHLFKVPAVHRISYCSVSINGLCTADEAAALATQIARLLQEHLLETTT